MGKQLEGSVVVITGASSGIGRAAALRFARRGAYVVLAARREQALQEIAEECQRRAGQALAVPTDVTDRAAVQALARRAIETFGRIDVWVNNAGVTMFGRFDESPPDEFRRVIDTNLFGYIYGAQAALPHMREQGSGAIINNSSVVALVGQPYTSAYAISKFAIRGLSASLREELRNEPIHVSTILPATIDTPLFRNAANYSGRAVKPMDPVYDAEDVADAIVWAAEHPVRELIIGNAGWMMAMLYAISPNLAERIMADKVERDHFQPIAAEATAGNLFEANPDWMTISGGWRPWRPSRTRRALQTAARSPAAGPATLALAALAGVLVGTMGRRASK